MTAVHFGFGHAQINHKLINPVISGTRLHIYLNVVFFSIETTFVLA